jgi:hypothetical protein
VLTLKVTLAGDAYQQPAAVTGFFTRMIERVRALPGVDGASLISDLFLSATPNSTNFSIEAAPTPAESVEVPVDSVAPGYFATMGIPVSTAASSRLDTAESTTVVVINGRWRTILAHNRRSAAGSWPAETNANANTNSTINWMTIVGVVGTDGGLRRPSAGNIRPWRSRVARHDAGGAVRPGSRRAHRPSGEWCRA